MKKIIITILTILALSSSNTIAGMDCSQFEKISAKYLECTAKNLKSKSIDTKNSKTLINLVGKE